MHMNKLGSSLEDRQLGKSAQSWILIRPAITWRGVTIARSKGA